VSLLKLACCCLASNFSFSGSYDTRVRAPAPLLIPSLNILPNAEAICAFQSFDCEPPKYPPNTLNAPPKLVRAATPTSAHALFLILSILSVKVAWMPCCSRWVLSNKPARSLLESWLSRRRRSKKE